MKKVMSLYRQAKYWLCLRIIAFGFNLAPEPFRTEMNMMFCKYLEITLEQEKEHDT